VDPQIQDELTLSSLNWSRQSGRFSARFSLGSQSPIKLGGTASLMIDIAVPKSAIAAGSTIAASDLQIRQVRAGRNVSRQLASLEQIIGLAARRVLRANKPVRLNDLEAPKLIRKNQLVTIMLEAPGLTLRTQGKALADASKGEAVRVLNTRSKRVIHATARADGLVYVKLAGHKRTGS
jgi:flagella basal body P-ring formation protein FlgA